MYQARCYIRADLAFSLHCSIFAGITGFRYYNHIDTDPASCRRMNFDVLMNLFRNDPRSNQIAEGIVLPSGTNQKPSIHLQGLSGSLSQFVLATVFQHPSTVTV